MEKLDGNTMDITKINIEKLKKLFPSIVVDGKIDFNMLKMLLGEEIDNTMEKYSFQWNGKNDTLKFSRTPSTGTLIPCKEKSLTWDGTKNLYIEGDNLEVLKLLQKTYFGKIKAIYIDPPYNTGQDFVYKDNFVNNIKNYKELTNQQSRANPNTNGRFHTDWLNMMYSRLSLASNLLTRDGLIFISIDDNEITNLRMICNEIFGEANFVATLKWKKKKQPSFLSTVAGIMEYVVVYSKNYDHVKKLCLEKLSDSDKPIINASNKDVERFFNVGLRVKADVEFIKKGVYQNKSMSIEYLDDIYIEDGRTKNGFRAIGRFRNDQNLITKYCEEDLIFITKNLGFRRDLSEEERDSGKTITDLLLDWGQNQDGSNQVKKLFDITNSDCVFDNPKPSLLIKNLITTILDKNDIVLDFFSGSATTAQAVFEYNIENPEAGINFILVQLPELCSIDTTAYKMGYKTICDVGEDRIKRASKYLLEECDKNNQQQDLFSVDFDYSKLDFGFKVFRLESTNIKPWDSSIQLDENSLLNFNETIKEGRTKLDVAYEIMLKYGVFDMPLKEVTISNKKMFDVGNGYMIICLEDDITMDDVAEIAKLKPHCVVFKEDGFKDDNEKMNATYTLERFKVEKVLCI